MKHALIAWCCLTASLSALEVHEWGTFTVLSGPDGRAISWYYGIQDIAGLPDFVHPGTTGKVGRAPIRMETPVIYFYPESPMDVAVEAVFEHGTITETFPYSTGEMKGIVPGAFLMMRSGKWSGTLHPPDDAAALSHIPEIRKSNPVEPYEAARAVPEAWIFESDVREIPHRENQPPFPEMEKFIFYRGVGFGALPFSATPGDRDVTITGEATGRLAFGVALRVRGEQAAWVAFGEAERGGSTIHVALPDALRPLGEVELELAAVWKSALVDAGMTPDEASAMVETWRHTWFHEEGDRVLTLVPRDVVDGMLPLKITPEPAKLERAFVARLEMITPARARALAELLQTEGEPTAAEIRKFTEIRLGRFAHGAAEIALGKDAPYEARAKINHIVKAVAEQEKAANP